MQQQGNNLADGKNIKDLDNPQRYPKSKNVTAYGLLSTTQTAKNLKKNDPEESLKK